MIECVVDASVAVKWVVEEIGSDRALKLLDGRKLHAPAHWLAEAVNALWGHVHRRVMAVDQAEAKVEVLVRAPVALAPLPELAREALALSLVHAVTVYDALYLALAKERRLPFVTNDRKLLRKLAGDPSFSALLLDIADVA